MYHTGYRRKAAVKLLIGLYVTLAILGSGIATDEKFTEFTSQPGTSIQTAVNTEPTGDSGQPEKTDPNRDSSSEVTNTHENLEPAKGLDGLVAEPTKLQNFRVGIHNGFTRIVFDSEGPRPLSIGPPSSEGISIRYQHLNPFFDPERFFRSYPGAIAKADYQTEEMASKISFTFRQPRTHAKTSFLEEYPPQKGSQEMRALDARSKPAMHTAQLQKTDPNAEKPGESTAGTRQIIPLEVTPRPARPATQLGLTPRGYTGRYFHVARPRLGLGLAYEFQEERIEGPNSDSKDKSDEFTQRLTIETNGWAYHPALCKYTLRFDPEWTQVKRVSDPGETSTDTTFEPYYAIDAFFLEPKPYTLHGFANRREIKLRSAFAAVTDTTIDTYGGDLRLKYRVLPTFFKYTHTDTDQSGFFESTGERDDFQLTSRHATSKSTTSLTGTYGDDERTSGGVTTRIKTFTGDIGNDLDIAGDRRKRLQSTLSYRWRDSDTSDDSFLQFRENLFWRHTDKLYTDYLLALETSDSNNFDRDTATFRAKLQHLLYENLTTTVQAGAVVNDTTAGRENIYDGNLDLRYRRKIPRGFINLRADLDYRFTERDGFEGSSIQVTNESHVLETGVETLLDNQNVDLNSIVVTDVTGTILYIENVDYTVQEVDSFTRISRTVVGAIANGQTVLVDYRFLSDPDFNDSVFGQAYDIQLYLWNALNLRYSYLRTDQNIVSGTPPENTVDDRAHAAEIRLDLGWTDTRFRYEDTDRSSGASTTRWLASQTFRLRPVRRFLTDVTGSYGWTDFKDRGETQDQYGLSGRLFWVPAGWFRFRVEGSWQKISGDLQDTEDTNVTAALELSYRIWNGGIYYRLSDLKNNDQKQIKNELRVEIIRILW
jgi:hypothetical protein